MFNIYIFIAHNGLNIYDTDTKQDKEEGVSRFDQLQCADGT